MSLIDIPPYVLADEEPPANSTSLRAFHLRTYQILEPIEFPRELFSDIMAEHARLLDAHLPEILAAPLDHPTRPADDRFVALEDLHECTTLLVSDGAAHEVHKWATVDASYVVQRCRGIVLRLMEVPPEGRHRVVVVARGVASLHLLRGIEPRRVGEGPRLEVVARDLVVEPWDQWHERVDRFVTTWWWSTPVGELVASRVPVRAWPSHARAVADSLMRIRGEGLRERIAAYASEEPDGKPLALMDTSVRGEEIDVVDRRGGDPFVDPFPEIVAALRVKRGGFAPVVVFAYHWAVLCWIALEAGADLAVPEPLVAKRVPQPGDGDGGDEDEQPEPKPKPKLRLRPNERLLAFFEDFPALAPWAPRATEVHGVWRAGLVLAVFLVLLFVSLGLLVQGMAWDRLTSALAVVAIGIATAGCLLAGSLLRYRLRNLDPARRERRWKAWKQLTEELEGEPRRPKPAPPVFGRKYWMKRLAQRLSRLERLVGLDAPDNIIESERRLVRAAIAELDESDAKAVLALWPTATRFLEPRGSQSTARKRGGTDKPN